MTFSAKRQEYRSLDTFTDLYRILTGTLDTLLTLKGNDWDSGYYCWPLVAKKELWILVVISLATTGTLDTTTDL